ncbi:MAG: nuclear transport factor 2 family protein [Planctomycetaceae bacterium]|nr:nuclear transport factor 2 family protein [Planctomycetaceae bacterium]
MRWVTHAVALMAVCMLSGTVHGQQPAENSDSPAASVPNPEKPFWEAAQAFLDAYTRKDAAAIGEMFTINAEFRDEFGDRTVGREAITKLFKRVFEENPEATLESIDIDRIRLIGDDIALEEGWVSARDTADGPLYFSRYVALHQLEGDGKWRINTLKDYPREEQGKEEQLDQLEWLIGDWVNEEGETIVKTSCRWSEDGNYLLRKYSAETVAGQTFRGVQRIAWDPQKQILRSWNFDTQGAFNEATWVRNGDQWVVTSTGVTAEGERVQSTSVYSIVDPERIVWTISSLVVGGEIMPNGHSIILTRAAPQPITSSN